MNEEEEIKVASVEDYRKRQKGYVRLQGDIYFEVEMIPFDKHLTIFNQLMKIYPKNNKRTLIFSIGNDDKVLRSYAELALPTFVKNPKVTVKQRKDSVGVDKMSYLDIQTLVTSALFGIEAPRELMESFRSGKSDIDAIMDELSSISSEAE